MVSVGPLIRPTSVDNFTQALQHSVASSGGFDGFLAFWQERQFLCYFDNLNFFVALQCMLG